MFTQGLLKWGCWTPSTLIPRSKLRPETRCLDGPQIERDEQLRTFQAYTNRFRSPYEQSYSTNPLYYSLDVGPIHAIMLNAVRTASLPLVCAGAGVRIVHLFYGKFSRTEAYVKACASLKAA